MRYEKCPKCGGALVKDEVELGGHRTRMWACPDCGFYDYMVPEGLGADWAEEVHSEAHTKAKQLLIKHGQWHVDVVVSEDGFSRKLRLSDAAINLLRKFATAIGKAGVVITAKRKRTGLTIIIDDIRPELVGLSGEDVATLLRQIAEELQEGPDIIIRMI